MKTLRFLIVSLFSLLAALPVFAQYKPGMSYLAMCHPDWSCAESLSVFNGLPEIRFRWLARTFGEQCPCVEKLLRDGRPKDASVVLVNWTCTRRGDCGAYEAFSGYSMKSADAAIRNREPKILKRFNDVITEAKKTLSKAVNLRSLFVVPCLECDLSDEARKILFDISRAAFPGANIIDSVYTSHCLSGTGLICEKHGPNPNLSAPCTADLDGVSAQKTDVQKYLSRTVQCALQFIWDEKFNCIDPHVQYRIDPRKRRCMGNQSYYNTNGRWLQQSQWFKPKLKPLNKTDTVSCRKMETASDGEGNFTWKQSDAHPGIVALLPKSERPKSLKLIRDGKVVATFVKAATFNGDGRPMWRSQTSQMDIYQITNAVLKSEINCRVLEYPGLRID